MLQIQGMLTSPYDRYDKMLRKQKALKAPNDGSGNALLIQGALTGLNVWNDMLLTQDELLWHHNRRDGVSNHQPHDCLLNHSIRRRSKKTSKFRVHYAGGPRRPPPPQLHLRRSRDLAHASIPLAQTPWVWLGGPGCKPGHSRRS